MSSLTLELYATREGRGSLLVPLTLGGGPCQLWVGGAGPAAESEGAGLGVLEGGQAGGSDRQPCRQEFTEPGTGATLPLSLRPCA